MISSLAKTAGLAACSALFAFSLTADYPSPFDFHLTFIVMAMGMLVVCVLGWNEIKVDVVDSPDTSIAGTDDTVEDGANKPKENLVVQKQSNSQGS